MRTPQEIAAEAHSLAIESVEKFVPLPMDRIALLSVEFMVSMSAAVATPAAVAPAPQA